MVTCARTLFRISIIEIPYHNKSEANPSALKMRFTNGSWENETMHKYVQNGLRVRVGKRQRWQSSTVVTWAQHLEHATIQVFFLSRSQSEHNTILGFVTQYLSLYCLSQKSMLFTWMCLRMCVHCVWARCAHCTHDYNAQLAAQCARRLHIKASHAIPFRRYSNIPASNAKIQTKTYSHIALATKNQQKK